MHIPHDRSTDENVFHGRLTSGRGQRWCRGNGGRGREPYEVRIPVVFLDADLIELDVQKLVNAFQRARDAEVVFEFYRHLGLSAG
jgi:hypothetical protein